jgi:hypothetical protein
MPGRSFLGIIVLSLFLIGCSKEPAVKLSSSSGSPGAESSRGGKRMGEKEYMVMMSTEAYDSVGLRKKEWDDAARRFLELRVLAGFDSTNRQDWEGVNAALKEAEKAGCDDPLVQYLALRLKHNVEDADATMTNAWTQAAERLQASNYPAYWKFYSALRADEAIKK